MIEMNSYERVMAVLGGKKETIDRLPCMNSASVSTTDFMKTFNASWPAAHKDAEKMAKLGSAAHRVCGLDNVSVPFSMTVEAEILGAVINYHEGAVKWPSITEFSIKDPSDLKFPDDVSKAGTVPVITKAIAILKKEFEGKVPINAYMVPPFTAISSYLVDSISFLKCIRTSPDTIHQYCRDTLDVFVEMATLYRDAGADVITFHEMGASNDNISPQHFNDFVKPYLQEMIKRLNMPIILNICGSAVRIVDKMAECGANAIAVDERTPIKDARAAVDKVKPGFPVIGNLPAFALIHQGPVERIREAVKKGIDDGVDVVASGCDFWLETPTEHIKALVDATAEFGKRSHQKFI